MEKESRTAVIVNRWWVLALVYMAMLAFAVTLQMIPPLLPGLVAKTGMSHAKAGALMGIFTLPGIFLALPGGRVSDALGPRSVAVWALSLLVLGTFLMLPLEPFFLFLGRICGGIGAGVLVVVSPQIVAQRFTGRELGRAMGVFNTAVPLGSITAFNLVGLLAERFSPGVAITATAGLAMTALAAFYLTYADLPMPTRTGETSAVPLVRGLGRGIWLTAVTWTLFNMGVLAYFTYVVDHLASVGTSEPAARFLGSFPMLLSIGFTPLAGLAIHRFGLKWSLSAVGCFVAAAGVTAVGLRPTGNIFLWSLVIGIGISMVPPAIFTIAGQVVPPTRTGTGYGILTTLFNLGIFFGVPLVGHTRDLTGSYKGSFFLMAALLCAGAILSGISKRMLSN